MSKINFGRWNHMYFSEIKLKQKLCFTPINEGQKDTPNVKRWCIKCARLCYKSSNLTYIFLWNVDRLEIIFPIKPFKNIYKTFLKKRSNKELEEWKLRIIEWYCMKYEPHVHSFILWSWPKDIMNERIFLNKRTLFLKSLLKWRKQALSWF